MSMKKPIMIGAGSGAAAGFCLALLLQAGYVIALAIQHKGSAEGVENGIKDVTDDFDIDSLAWAITTVIGMLLCAGATAGAAFGAAIAACWSRNRHGYTEITSGALGQSGGEVQSLDANYQQDQAEDTTSYQSAPQLVGNGHSE